VFPADDALDIVGGDLAIGAKTVTVVVKTKADPAASPSPLYVRRYIVEFKVAGLANKVVLAAAFGLDGTTYSYGYYSVDSTGSGTYSYDGAASGTGVAARAARRGRHGRDVEDVRRRRGVLREGFLSSGALTAGSRPRARCQRGRHR
jgi:hypothetical protein